MVERDDRLNAVGLVQHSVGAQEADGGAIPQRFARPAAESGGGAEGIRTPDLLIANETRYQLRHSPSCGARIRPAVEQRRTLSVQPTRAKNQPAVRFRSIEVLRWLWLCVSGVGRAKRVCLHLSAPSHLLFGVRGGLRRCC